MGPGFVVAAALAGEVFLLDREMGEIDILRVLNRGSGAVWDGERVELTAFADDH